MSSPLEFEQTKHNGDRMLQPAPAPHSTRHDGTTDATGVVTRRESCTRLSPGDPP